MNDRLLKRLILKEIRSVLKESGEGKNTSVLEEVEGIAERFKKTLCQELKDEHMENRSSEIGRAHV